MAELSVIISVAPRCPVELGEKLSATWHFDPAFSPAPAVQVVVVGLTSKLPPIKVTLPIISLDLL